MKQQHSFTLVELMTVIVIIMILIGILLPVIGSVIRRGEEAATKSRIKALTIAVAEYESRYGIRPSIDASVGGANDDATVGNVGDNEIAENSDANEQFISLLTDVTTGANGLGNVRGIRFLTPTDAKVPLSYLDAWGQPFRIKLDTSYNEEMDGGTLPGVGDASILYLSIAVVSGGPDEDFSTADDNVNSWEQ